MNAADVTYPSVLAPDGDYAALRERQFAELARLGEVGMAKVETLARWSTGDITDQEAKILAGMGGYGLEYCRISKAIRQIIILEQELAGLRPAPDRDAVREPRVIDLQAARGEGGYRTPNDLYERSDYDNGPLDEVVAGIRKALRADAPPDDPFRPKRSRQAPEKDAPVEAASADMASADLDIPPLKVANDGGTAPARAAMRPRNDFGAPPSQTYNRAARRKAEHAARSRGPPQ